MERHCPRGQSPSRAVAPVKKKKKKNKGGKFGISSLTEILS
jgi:hypothetical protein